MYVASQLGCFTWWKKTLSKTFWQDHPMLLWNLRAQSSTIVFLPSTEKWGIMWGSHNQCSLQLECMCHWSWGNTEYALVGPHEVVQWNGRLCVVVASCSSSIQTSHLVKFINTWYTIGSLCDSGSPQFQFCHFYWAVLILPFYWSLWFSCHPRNKTGCSSCLLH